MAHFFKKKDNELDCFKYKYNFYFYSFFREIDDLSSQ